MPVRKVSDNPDCYQWGNQKIYCGKGAKEKAIKQGIAIEKTGWREAETFEAAEWAGYCPKCKKWRTKEMSKKATPEIMKYKSKSLDEKHRGKLLCGKRDRGGLIQVWPMSPDYYGNFDVHMICGMPLTKVKKKAETFEAEGETKKIPIEDIEIGSIFMFPNGDRYVLNEKEIDGGIVKVLFNPFHHLKGISDIQGEIKIGTKFVVSTPRKELLKKRFGLGAENYRENRIRQRFGLPKLLKMDLQSPDIRGKMRDGYVIFEEVNNPKTSVTYYGFTGKGKIHLVHPVWDCGCGKKDCERCNYITPHYWKYCDGESDKKQFTGQLYRAKKFEMDGGGIRKITGIDKVKYYLGKDGKLCKVCDRNTEQYGRIEWGAENKTTNKVLLVGGIIAGLIGLNKLFGK
tara:strand:- start:413 stop:1612 length:1200 start_codon:yes stop_codon:yes gene_type:complete